MRAATLPVNHKNKEDLPLVVDLDGTPVQSDLMWEAIFLVLKTGLPKPARLFGWLLQGKAGFKARLADAVTPDFATMVLLVGIGCVFLEEPLALRKLVGIGIIAVGAFVLVR